MTDNIDKISADKIGTVANIVSGLGRHDLANELWQLEYVLRSRLKRKKQDEDQKSRDLQ